MNDLTLEEKVKAHETLIKDLVEVVGLLESKISKQQRLLNILVFRAQESIIDLTESELEAMADLAENLKREGIELDV